jgi:hypothetical protein
MKDPLSTSVPSRITWIDLIDESVHTYDDVDIGDIDAVSRDFIVIKRGFVNVHMLLIVVRYTIPTLLFLQTQEEISRRITLSI